MQSFRRYVHLLMRTMAVKFKPLDAIFVAIILNLHLMSFFAGC
jgi:hypothetical protein